MSKTIRIVWPAADTDSVCLAQQVVAGGSFNINGALATVNVPAPYAEFVGLERKVSLTSAADVSADNFTITGYYRGAIISEVISGPNATTKQSVNLYTKVISITSEFTLTDDVSIGTGNTGNTIWLRSDYQRSVNNATVGVKVLATAITYTFEASLDDPIATPVPYIIAPIDSVTIPTIPAATDMIDATVTSAADYSWPVHSVRVRVSASDATGALNFYFLQQGQT
jgi:hypothetical protein